MEIDDSSSIAPSDSVSNQETSTSNKVYINKKKLTSAIWNDFVLIATKNLIKFLKLQTITLDNALANDAAICELATQFSSLSININTELLHNHYLAHIINIIVQDSTKKISD
ncbi:5418_t:CDS:2, partial [Scutellospora calospora]